MSTAPTALPPLLNHLFLPATSGNHWSLYCWYGLAFCRRSYGVCKAGCMHPSNLGSSDFKVIFSCSASPRLAWASWDPVSKARTKQTVSWYIDYSDLQLSLLDVHLRYPHRHEAWEFLLLSTGWCWIVFQTWPFRKQAECRPCVFVGSLLLERCQRVSNNSSMEWRTRTWRGRGLRKVRREGRPGVGRQWATSLLSSYYAHETLTPLASKKYVFFEARRISLPGQKVCSCLTQNSREDLWVKGQRRLAQRDQFSGRVHLRVGSPQGELSSWISSWEASRSSGMGTYI